MDHPEGQTPERSRPFPKKKYKGQSSIDKDRIKLMYLAGSHYSWVDFCKAHRFSLNNNMQFEVPFKSWQQFWLRQRIIEQNEDVIPEAMKVRPTVLKGRIQMIPEYYRMVKNWRAILEYRMNEMAKAIRHDQANPDAPKQFGLTHSQSAFFTQALKSTWELEQQILMVQPSKSQSTMLPIPEISADDQRNEAEADDLANAPVYIKGMEGVPIDKLSEALSKWFDNAPELKGEGNTTGNAEPISEVESSAPSEVEEEQAPAMFEEAISQGQGDEMGREEGEDA